MSIPTPAEITQTLSDFDMLVRQGLEDGNIQIVMKEHAATMVSRYALVQLIVFNFPAEIILQNLHPTDRTRGGCIPRSIVSPPLSEALPPERHHPHIFGRGKKTTG